MNRPFSVLIPDGESEFALFVVHNLAAFSNVKIHVLSSKQWAPVRFSRHCHSYKVRPSGVNEQALLDIVADLVKKQKIDVILPTETKWISFAIANREALSSLAALVPLPEVRTFEIANNKWLLAQFLAKHGIPGPPTVLLTDFAKVEKELQAMRFPVLLKPITAWGGEGIARFETFVDLKHYLTGQDPKMINSQFIVQSFLAGTIVGVNVLSRHGNTLACTMQKGIIPNTQKYAAAGGIRFIKDDRFLQIAQKLVAALGWSGFANIDTLHDSRDDQLKILEINARFWGSLRGSFVAGVNFPYLACLVALDVDFLNPDYELTYYIHSKTALRERLLKLVGKNKELVYNFQETGLRFLLADPWAETIRAFQQEILDQ